MRLSRRLALVILAIALSLTLLLVTLLQTRAESQRLVRWWAGGDQVAYRFGKRCTDTVTLDFYALPVDTENSATAEITWRSERTNARFSETVIPERCMTQNGPCAWWLEVWSDFYDSYETVSFTHRLRKTLNVNNLNTGDPAETMKLGDRIEVIMEFSDNGIEGFYTTLDCSSHTYQYISGQGDDNHAAPSSETGPSDACEVGTLVKQYEMTVDDRAEVEALDVAMYFIGAPSLRDARAELTSPAGTTVALWDGFAAEDELGWRCETSLDGDPMADFVLTDQSVFPLPDVPPVYPDRAYQPRESLAAFAGEPMQGTWTLNICRTAPQVPEIPNGDFESAHTAWNEFSSNGYPLIYHSNNLPVMPHGGFWAAWLGGAHLEVAQIAQTVIVPDDAPVLSYYQYIASEDFCGYDTALVYVNNVVQTQRDMCLTTDGWELETLDLSAHAGNTVYLAFEVATDGSLLSSQFLDNVAWYTESQAEALPHSRTVADPDAAPQKSPDVTANTAPQGGGDQVQCWYLNFKNSTPPVYTTFLPAMLSD